MCRRCGRWNATSQQFLLLASILSGFRIVINRWHRTDEEALKAFEKKIRRPIFARLPNDFRQVSEAINLGMPLSKNHNDPLVVKFRQLACELAGISPTTAAKRGTIFNLFSPQSTK